MQNKNGLAWGYTLALGLLSGGAAVRWLGLAGLDAWGLVVVFVLVALGSRALAAGPGRAPSEAELLEFDILLCEGMAQFRAQYGLILEEVGRIESLLADAIATLTQSFNGLHQQGRQRSEALFPTATTGGLLAQEAAQAVTALQFQDMVSQLMRHVKIRISALDDVVRHFGDIALTLRQEGHKGDTRGAAISLQQEVIRMRQSLADLALRTSHNPVVQNAMAHGDVELF